MVPLLSGRLLRLGLSVLLALTAVSGCQPLGRQTVFANTVRNAERTHVVPAGVTLCDSCSTAGLRPQRNVLALSSGGLYGAYSTGFLSGWTKTGTRPEFDTVTGVSVGSLIAPFAFLGSDYDGIAMELYTGVRAEHVFKMRTWVTIPFKDAAASSGPLKKLIESQITPDMLTQIAAEHAKGRRLYVATTSLDTRRTVIWDMGAIASLAGGRELFCSVLLASSSVPGMLPPVPFMMPRPDGSLVSELHSDGGITTQLFLPSVIFRAAEGETPGVPVVPGANGNVYAIISGKLYPDPSPVRRKVLPILGATTESLLYAHCRAELGNIYRQSRLSGMRFHFTALESGIVVRSETPMSIDPAVMQMLYREGERNGLAGPHWQFVPPDLCSPPPHITP